MNVTKQLIKLVLTLKRKILVHFINLELILMQEKKKGKAKECITYFHVQDIECYETHNDKFVALINEIKKLEEETGVYYQLGYTNYTFDLWIIIHKRDMFHCITNRDKYYKDINKAFKTSYNHMDEYKKEEEFRKILNSITLDDVINAVARGEKIRKNHEDNNDHKEIVNGFIYYRNNPDMTLHSIVKQILVDVGILKK